ncbi:MAG: AraC family ligand binding domain-containing protein [Patescibacteria group bacterium]
MQRNFCSSRGLLFKASLVDESIGGRAIRIEVVDTKIEQHAHDGATFVIVGSGSGIFRCADADFKIRAGDIIYVPPNTAHLSIADEHTTMTEWVVYLGAEHDPQISLPV